MFLGLDIGTSGVKAVIWDGAEVTAQATAPLSTQAPQPGWSEQAPEAWWQAVLTACAELARSTDLNAIKAVGLSGQMHGLVTLDAAHRVLRPAILWNDSRSALQCSEAEARDAQIGHIAGVRPLPGFTAPKMTWLKTHEPGVYARIAHVLLPKDYIGFRLHGALVMDRSDAAGTLWLDQSTRTWSDRMCALFDTDPAVLPRLADGAEVVGALTPEVSQQLGLPSGLAVVAGAGDAAAGAVALGATEPGRGFISLGTSGQLFVASDHYAPNPERFVHAFAHTVPDRWYQMAAMLNGARPLDWMAGVLHITVPELLAAAARAETARVPLFLPYLTGERSPHGDPHIRGAFYGLEDSTDTDAMCRAVVEAVAFTFADAVDSFGPTLDGVPHLLAIGGGSRSDFLLQMIADVTAVTLARGASAEAGPAVGAAKLAALGVRAIDVSALSASPETQQTFTPVARPVLQARQAQYRALYQALRPLAQPDQPLHTG